ncbi:OmpA family protein [Vibrio parahaemolyticus]|nr:OmpA family protein [Vibrio parahaemolyticus]
MKMKCIALLGLAITGQVNSSEYSAYGSFGVGHQDLKCTSVGACDGASMVTSFGLSKQLSTNLILGASYTDYGTIESMGYLTEKKSLGFDLFGRLYDNDSLGLYGLVSLPLVHESAYYDDAGYKSSGKYGLGITMGVGAEYLFGSNLSVFAEGRYTHEPSSGSDNYVFLTGLRFNVSAGVGHLDDYDPLHELIEPIIHHVPVVHNERFDRVGEFYFDHGEFVGNGVGTLDEYGLLLSLYDDRDLVVYLLGYADNSGSDEFNYKLSGYRAEWVRDWLIDIGISKSRIKILAFGSHDQLILNHSDEVEPMNRRVDVFLGSSKVMMVDEIW